jgi:hypothetical protein
MLNKLYPPLSSEIRTRIITLWSVLLVGALVVGGIAAYMGSFVRGNVADQLGSQQIVFTAAADLKPVEKAEDVVAGGCLSRYGGTLMTTGDQARCYANHYIGLHTRESAITAGFPGATYATLGAEQTKIRAEIAAAQTEGANPDAIKALNDKLTAAGNLRTTMQTSSTLRGQLLNAWGWDTFGMGIMVTGVALIAIALVFGAALVYELRTKSVAEEDAVVPANLRAIPTGAR